MKFLSRTAGFIAIALCALLVTPSEAPAQYFGRNKVQYDDFDFFDIATEHFTLYYYPEEQLAVRDAARMAERWYTRLSPVFQLEYPHKPLIFYANDADFQQTNVIEGLISQRVGGVTEALQNRVVMPLTGIYRETDHVLGHELVHTFQYDLVQRSPGSYRDIGRVPLWLVEGMAEYLTVGRDDPHTAMWMRDALLNDALPTIEELRDPRFFPYRFGQAYSAFIGGHWGDQAVTDVFRLAAQTSLDSALIAVTGLNSEQLSARWQEEIRALYGPALDEYVPPEETGRPVLAPDIDAGEMNFAPAVSPDGRYVAFLSERSLFEIELYVADTETGEVIEQLSAPAGDPHFDALRFINSAGAWSPDGEQFAYIVFAEGDNEIHIVDVEEGSVVRRIEVADVGAIANPAWSPDGRYLAFSGIHGGISDLFLYDFETEQFRQLTDDRYADLQPDWSPDGSTLVFSTDRGPYGTNFDTLTYAELRLGFIDVASGEIRTLVPFNGAKHIDPQFSPAGNDVYFISDVTGVSNIYRLDVSTEQLYRVTNVATGVSGITGTSPALSVADRNGLLMFSVFHDGDYIVNALEPEQARGTRVDAANAEVATAGLLPPAEAVEDPGLVGAYLLDPQTGLPTLETLEPDRYDPTLRLSYIGPPTVGIGYDTQFGAGVSGAVSFLFSDVLGNQLVGTSLQAGGSFRSLGAELFYLNRSNQLNYGIQLSHTPYVTGTTRASQDPQTGLQQFEQIIRTTYFTGGQLFAQYPLSTTRRIEAQAGYTHIWSDLDVERILVTPTNDVIARDTDDLDAPDPLDLISSSAAWVTDYSFFGFTSPVRGGRSRYEVGFNVGTFQYGTLLIDYRRYFFLRPFTVAFGAYHYGRYFASEEAEDRLYPLNVGYSIYNVRGVHGYSIYSFDVDECRGGAENCPVFDRVIGSRVAVASIELRFPLLGTSEFGLIDFPFLPTELAIFGDAGLAWTSDRAPEFAFVRESTRDNVPVFSTGIAARINLLGALVLEPFYAYPFQRPDEGWVFGLTLSPGW